VRNTFLRIWILALFGKNWYTVSMKKKYYTIPKLNIAVFGAAGLLVLSAILRIIYYTGVNVLSGEIWMQCVLPVCTCILLTIMLFTSAGDRLYRTSVPVLLGCVFFAVKAVGFSPVHRILCWCLYLAVAGLYYVTVQYGLCKWILGGVITCAMAYHIVVEDLKNHAYRELYTAALRGDRTADWHFMAELTVLLVMAALLLMITAMKRQETDGWRASWGDRNDGRRLRSLDPIFAVTPYVMWTRNTSANLLRDSMECSAVDEYIRRKRQEGLQGFGILHVVLAAYARCVAEYPGLNRFISGQRVYSRNELEVAMTIKTEMTAESPDTVIKMYLDPSDRAEDVYRKAQEQIETVKKAPTEETDFDILTKAFNFVPGLLLKFVVWLLRVLDYFGCLPRALTRLSPFHGSMYITSLASLGIPPVFHHLYDFGNVPVFVALGKKRRVNELEKDGSVVSRKYIDYTFVTDERICDGYYYAAVLRCFRNILQNPDCLDQPPEVVKQDVK